VADTTEPDSVRWGVMALALAAAAGSLILLFATFWSYVPARAEELVACHAAHLPRLTETVLFVTQWTLRLLPFIIMLGGPAVLVVAVIVGSATIRSRGKHGLARLVTIFSAALTFIALLTCGLAVYAMQAGCG
jgi:hypothetical protein